MKKQTLAYTNSGELNKTYPSCFLERHYHDGPGFHTVMGSVTEFTGTINYQVAYKLNPLEEEWISIKSQSYTRQTTNFYFNFVSKALQIRVVLNRSQSLTPIQYQTLGEINYITLSF